MLNVLKKWRRLFSDGPRRRSSRPRLGVESLEAREVPATFTWSKVDGGSTYYNLDEQANGRYVNLKDVSGDNPLTSAVSFGSDTVLFDSTGNARCQLSQQNYGAMTVLNNYTGAIKSFSSGLVLNGYTSSSFNGTSGSKMRLELQGDMVIDANICTFDYVDVTWGSPHNIQISAPATLNIRGTVDSNHNIVNYGTLNFGGSTYSGSTYNIINNTGDTLYIANNSVEALFNWGGTQAGNAANPNLFYVQNKGTFNFTMPTGVSGAAVLKGAYWNDHGATQMDEGFLTINGKVSKAGFSDKSIIGNYGTWDQQDKATVKYSFNAIWNYATFDLRHATGGDYVVTLSAFSNVATETRFNKSDVALNHGAGTGMVLDVTGNLNALVFRGCNVYETVWFDTNTSDRISSGYTFDAGGYGTDMNYLYVSADGTVHNGLWTMTVSQSTYTPFSDHVFPSLPGGKYFRARGAVPNGLALEMIGADPE